MWLIVGLGNPSERYAGTYHNVGFQVLDRIAAREKVRIVERCGQALISSHFTIAGQSAVLAAPQTFMNNSGAAMSPLFERFEATPRDVIVVYDDIALPLGRIRVRQKGSAGGHNGIKSLVSAFESDGFFRIRVGIQPGREIADVREFVLSPVAKVDLKLLAQAEELAVRAVDTLIAAGIDEAMSQFNGIDLREEEN
jgi:PTH1 family peptidyl-tRNA hydrolase